MEDTSPEEETSEPEVVFVGEPATVNVNAAPQVSGGMPIQTNAVAGLVFAIIGVISVLTMAASTCGILGCCGLIFTLPSMLFVNSDKKKIENNPSHSDAGMIKASNVFNIISLVISGIGLVLIVISVVFFGGLAAIG